MTLYNHFWSRATYKQCYYWLQMALQRLQQPSLKKVPEYKNLKRKVRVSPFPGFRFWMAYNMTYVIMDYICGYFYWKVGSAKVTVTANL